MTQPKASVFLSYPETDFTGDPCVVAQMWLEHTENKPAYEPPERPRWDMIMRQPLEKCVGLWTRTRTLL